MTGALESVTFDVLGVELVLGATKRSLVQPLWALMAGFRAPARAEMAGPDRCAIVLKSRGSSDQELWIDDRCFPIDGSEELLTAHAYSVLFDSIFAKVERYTLLHAAALSYRGMGVILCGASGTGKSSLAFELARREGWELMSDDVAPVERGTGRLAPFPKALSLRPGVIDVDALGRHAVLPVLDGKRKRLFSPESVGAKLAVSPVPIRLVLFVGDEALHAGKASDTLTVVVHRWNDSLIGTIGREGVIEHVRRVRGERFDQLVITTSVPTKALTRITEICNALGCLVIGSSLERHEVAPRFLERPQIVGVDLAAGVVRSFQHLWGTARHREEAGGAALFGEVAGALAGAAMGELHPGPLQRTAELVEQTVAAKSLDR